MEPSVGEAPEAIEVPQDWNRCILTFPTGFEFSFSTLPNLRVMFGNPLNDPMISRFVRDGNTVTVTNFFTHPDANPKIAIYLQVIRERGLMRFFL